MDQLNFLTKLFSKRSHHKSVTFLALEEKQARVTLLQFFDKYEVWERQKEYRLPLGLEPLIQGFRGFPPDPQELEAAIEVLEEAIMPLAANLPKEHTFVCILPSGVQLAFMSDLQGRGLNAKVDEHLVLSREDVEDIFVRLAEVAQGGAVSASGLPRDMVFMAAVLLLREFMHHLDFTEVTMVAEDQLGR